MKKIFITLILVIFTCSNFLLVGCTMMKKEQQNVPIEDNNQIQQCNEELDIKEKAYSKAMIKHYFSEEESYQFSLTDNAISSTIILYDLDNNPQFVLYENNGNGYLIYNRLTGISYERCYEGFSPYYGIEGLKYYNGFNNYLYKTDDKIIDIKTDTEFVVNESTMNNQVKGMVNSDIIENGLLDYDSTVSLNSNKEYEFMPMTSPDNEQPATKESRWGNYDVYASSTANTYFSSLPSWTQTKLITASTCDVFFDKCFPTNDDNSCGIVALIMLMQYYERTGLRRTIPKNFYETHYVKYYKTTKGTGAIDLLTEHLKYEFEMIIRGSYESELPIFSSGLESGINAFYNIYGDEWVTQRIFLTCNVAYNNVVGCIQRGDLAIIETGATGYGYYTRDGGWYRRGVSAHHMVVYGYCTTSTGTLKDFICHSGWGTSGTQKMYVYKFNVVNNVTELF